METKINKDTQVIENSNRLFQNLNASPVRTWSWLKVNDISLEAKELPQVDEYRHSYFSAYAQDSVKVNQISLDAFPELPAGFQNYKGVSGELLQQCIASFNAGVEIHIEKGDCNVLPVFLDYRLDNTQNALVDYNLIQAEEDSKLTVILKYSSQDQGTGYHNGLLQVIAKKNAIIKLIKLQDFNEKTLHIDSNILQLEEGAQVEIVVIDVGSEKSIVNYKGILQGEASKISLNGAYIGQGEKVLDMNYHIQHKGRNTVSSILSKGALMDQSQKNFRGTIEFQKGCKGSKGREEEYAMLLSGKARSKALPLLLCDEEEIEGSHAASAGRIDENSLFYVMSRGYGELQAKKLIIEAEWNPLLDGIEDPVFREEIKELLGRRLYHESSI